jgi:hypothetical protein
MMDNEIAELLAEHADGLNLEADVSGQLLEENSEHSAELATLFELARAVKTTLVPVNAAAFKASLRHRLARHSPQRHLIKRITSSQNVIWVVVAGAGSVLSIAGVLLIVLRKVKSSGNSERQPISAPI